MPNYFNSLSLRDQLAQLGKCEFMDLSNLQTKPIPSRKKLVMVGCGSQGLNRGLNLRDSGLSVAFAEIQPFERKSLLAECDENGFEVGTYKTYPGADLVLNLPDKQHSSVRKNNALNEKNACLSYYGLISWKRGSLCGI